MLHGLTLVVSERSVTADNLCAAVNSDGLPARVVSPAEVLAGRYADEDCADFLLINASLRLHVVGRLTQWFMQRNSRLPTVVMFAERDFRELEEHVTAGLDYIIPPFLPGLVGSRLAAFHVRQVMSRTARDIQFAANLVKYERELHIGREIQAGFLPDVLPAPEGWQLTARCQPALEVGGDFYDAFEVLGGTRIGLVVADVCDKGVGAAMFMALIRSLIRHTAGCLDPCLQPGAPAGPERDAAGTLLSQAIVTTNRYLTTNHLAQGYFATMFFGVLDPADGSLVYANCGHNPPVVRRADGEQSRLWPTGPALGLVPGSVFDLGRIRLGHGDLLFAYTDGIPEAKDVNGRFFGDDRMLALIQAKDSGADELVEMFERRLAAHVGFAERSDDITMLALHRRPDDRDAEARGKAAAGPPWRWGRPVDGGPAGR
ncbi:PP2C family protein-serine/threonine phosphatase [Actinoplanes sp. KI2]|uniref:PP2C family protein-serine/threonine phosphatase n=1 Tax=Actinoplanes sp. KI2 TaxID=2983315 RepID=UPI0021D59C34|nr:PP2C family protein-serine/threonine phosphatase [Actinoplanes sp. KI2]MCU7729568.1 PP2C family protein-serine/threonine phosphatase [Actinoplanes sp. KI2]